MDEKKRPKTELERRPEPRRIVSETVLNKVIQTIIALRDAQAVIELLVASPKFEEKKPDTKEKKK